LRNPLSSLLNSKEQIIELMEALKETMEEMDNPETL
jgi:hypothetical protein